MYVCVHVKSNMTVLPIINVKSSSLFTILTLPMAPLCCGFIALRYSYQSHLADVKSRGMCLQLQCIIIYIILCMCACAQTMSALHTYTYTFMLVFPDNKMSFTRLGLLIISTYVPCSCTHWAAIDWLVCYRNSRE